MSQYYSLITQAGTAAEASAKGLGQLVNLNEFAVGDSNGVEYDPTGSETALKNEIYRGAISSITVDPNNANQFIVDCVVPRDQGGFTIREAAIFTDKGVMYGIAKHPPSFKTITSSGTASELRVKFVFATSNASSINLLIDPSIVNATREYVDASANITMVTGNQTTVRNKEHLFLAHADLQLRNEIDGTVIDVVVDRSVDLTTGQCRVLPPSGEKVQSGDNDYQAVEILEKQKVFRIRRVNGVWKV